MTPLLRILCDFVAEGTDVSEEETLEPVDVGESEAEEFELGGRTLRDATNRMNV
jgi:hypothetical protein